MFHSHTSFIVRLTLPLILFWAAAHGALAAERPALSRVQTALAQDRFVSYVPRSFSTAHGSVQPASAEGIRSDLTILRRHFSGLITYGIDNGQDRIPELAVAAGFRSLILGVWNPADRAELDRAIALAQRHPAHVIALVLGNEGLFWKRYNADDVRNAATYVRARLPNLAVAGSEPFAVYLDSPDAAALLELDLLLPNIHPRFEPWFQPGNMEQAAEFVVQVLDKLHALSPRPILIKETGLPSAPQTQGFSEARQAEFWRLLRARIPAGPTQNLAAFEAFDAPWKPREMEDEFGRLEPSEAYWGLFRHDGSPKAAAAAFEHSQSRGNSRQAPE